MKPILWLAMPVILAASVRGYSGSEDRPAHIKLTDGVRATSGQNDSAWLTLFADSTQLPKQKYALGEFCFWGANAPIGINPKDNPTEYELLKSAGIKGVRYDTPWYGLQQYQNNIQFNWYGIEDNINEYIKDGFSVICTLGYTPAWANGMRDRQYAPSKPVEAEVVNLNAGSASLANRFIITHPPEITPFLLTPNPAVTSRHTDEIVASSFEPGSTPKVLHSPIVPGSEEVWVDEGAGWEKWSRVVSMVDSTETSKEYVIDRSGSLHFGDSAKMWGHGKIPAKGSRVKIAYDSIDKVYSQGSDYSLNAKTGLVTIRSSLVAPVIQEDNFGTSGLDAGWSWINEPSKWNVNKTTPNNLYVSASGGDVDKLGHFLYQTISGSGDFAISARLSNSPKTGNPASRAGICVYQDANNWFRYGLTNDEGRPNLLRCINGAITSLGGGGELGFQVEAPRWISLRKSGDSWTVFTSKSNADAPDGGYQVAYTFDFKFSYPMKVGLAFAGSGDSDVDSFVIKIPGIRSNASLLAWYDHLDTKPWTDYIKAVVGHFKDRVKYWELWNEPDQGWCFNSGQDIFAEIVRTGAEAIRDVDPGAKVVTGGYANGATANVRTLYENVPSKPWDLVAWHPYMFDNRSPDAMNWAKSETNYVGRQAMLDHGDSAKDVMLGEFCSDSGVLGAGGGMNERKQADYGIRALLMSRALGYVQAIQWWPPKDLSPLGVREDDIFGGHGGLLRADGSPKPAYYAVKNLATNKGVLIDLVDYDSSSKPVPSAGQAAVKQVVIGVLDQAKIASIKVLVSLSATDNAARPSKAVARFIGSGNPDVMVASIDKSSPDLKSELWTAVAISTSSFKVTGSSSGDQGHAVEGSVFTSSNGVVTFTLPSRTYAVGDKWQFETFAGDGFTEAGAWTNNGVSGKGDITIELPQPVDARYVSIQFTKASGAASFAIDEITIKDASGLNVGKNKLYIVDGYQPWFHGGQANLPGNSHGEADPPVSELPQTPTTPTLNMTLQGMPMDPHPGSVLDLKLTYTNPGRAPAANVLVTSPLPRHASYVPDSASDGGVYDPTSKTIRWTVSLLAPDTTGTVSFKVKID